MRDLDRTLRFLREYNGPEMNIMEVCGSHTGSIAKNGIPELLSPKIHLISGPGCPVCVTPSSYIDRLIELSLTPGTCVVTFGDLLRVPGSRISLSEAKGLGGQVKMVYSPLDVILLAEAEPETNFVFAAVGFETTSPVYALLMEELLSENLHNVRLLTAMKSMPEVIGCLCEKGADVQGFLAPGHVSVITGSRIFEPLASHYRIPFGVAGFGAEDILIALEGIVEIYSDSIRNNSPESRGRVVNYYPSAVTEDGNRQAMAKVDTYFEKSDALWRGLGMIPGSGRVLRPEYAAFDAGSSTLTTDTKKNAACCCDRVLTGHMRPSQCPLFGKGCTPMRPQGACMVSAEGNCHTWFVNHRQ